MPGGPDNSGFIAFLSTSVLKLAWRRYYIYPPPPPPHPLCICGLLRIKIYFLITWKDRILFLKKNFLETGNRVGLEIRLCFLQNSVQLLFSKYYWKRREKHSTFDRAHVGCKKGAYDQSLPKDVSLKKKIFLYYWGLCRASMACLNCVINFIEFEKKFDS